MEEAQAIFAYREGTLSGAPSTSGAGAVSGSRHGVNHVARWSNEVRLGLDALIWWCTIWHGVPSPGQALFNLKLEDARASSTHATLVTRSTSTNAPPPSKTRRGPSVMQKVLLGMGSVLLPYLWQRAATYLEKYETQQLTSQIGGNSITPVPGGVHGSRRIQQQGRQWQLSAKAAMSAAEKPNNIAELANNKAI